jgi:hypothetical protein
MNKHEDLRIGQIIKILRAALGLKQKDHRERGIQPHYLSLGLAMVKRQPSLQICFENWQSSMSRESLVLGGRAAAPNSITYKYQERFWKSPLFTGRNGAMRPGEKE